MNDLEKQKIRLKIISISIANLHDWFDTILEEFSEHHAVENKNLDQGCQDYFYTDPREHLFSLIPVLMQAHIMVNEADFIFIFFE